MIRRSGEIVVVLIVLWLVLMAFSDDTKAHEPCSSSCSRLIELSGKCINGTEHCKHLRQEVTDCLKWERKRRSFVEPKRSLEKMQRHETAWIKP